MSKVCTACDIEKLLSEFGKDSAKKDGYRPSCKECKRASDKRWREQNLEKKRATDRKYAQDHAEDNCLRAREWYRNNSVKARETRKKWYLANIDKVNQNRAAYNSANQEKMRAWMNDYMKARYATNTNYRVKQRLNSRIRDYVRKDKPTMNYIGCSTDELKAWLEFQFDANMTWENMGSFWELDHVIPCAAFDFSDETEIAECYNWRNLQPLAARDNAKKGSKIIADMIEKHEQLVSQYIAISAVPSTAGNDSVAKINL